MAQTQAFIVLSLVFLAVCSAAGGDTGVDDEDADLTGRAGSGGFSEEHDPVVGGAGAQGGQPAAGGAAGQAGDDAVGGGAGAMATAGTGGEAKQPPPAGQGGQAGSTPGPTGDCKGAPVCEDFESLESGKAPSGNWSSSASGNGAVVKIDGKHVFSGSKSVYIGSASSGPTAFIQPKNLGTWQKDDMYGRVMFYFEQQPTGGAGPLHFALIEGSGTVDSTAGAGTGRKADVKFSGFNDAAAAWATTYYATGGDAGTADCSRKYSLPIQQGKWICYEWHWNKKTHAWAAWADEFPLLGLHFKASDGVGFAVGGDTLGKKCWLVPTISSLKIGWMQVRVPDGKLAMWLDDVAISDTRIGCADPGGSAVK